MVRANNAIRLREIRDRVVADNGTFENVHNVSVSTIARGLAKQHVMMKQLYTVPFERNSERVRELRYQYIQVRCPYTTVQVSMKTKWYITRRFYVSW